MGEKVGGFVELIPADIINSGMVVYSIDEQT